MFETSSLIAFFATSLVLIAIPGPSVMFIIGRTLAEGRRAGILTVLFNSLGHTTWMFAVAFGLGEVLALYPMALQAIQIIGAIYLGYLGVQTIRHRETQSSISSKSNHLSLGRIAKEGYIVGFSNPKVAVFFMAVLPQFVTAGDNFTLQFIVLGLIFEVMGIAGDTFYSLMSGAAREWIFSKSSRMSAIAAVGGSLIVGLGLILLVSSLISL
ncbi:MAG: LysE family translocator [Micrococcales bacterium]